MGRWRDEKEREEQRKRYAVPMKYMVGYSFLIFCLFSLSSFSGATSCNVYIYNVYVLYACFQWCLYPDTALAITRH